MLLDKEGVIHLPYLWEREGEEGTERRGCFGKRSSLAFGFWQTTMVKPHHNHNETMLICKSN